MLTKQGIDISFAEGLDTKTDPKRLTVGKFTALNNSVFTKGGQLTKRNGFGSIADVGTGYLALNTLNQNLTAVGTNIAAYDGDNDTWVQKGSITPLELSTLPAIRNTFNQTQCDAVIAPNGLVGIVYTESTGSALSYKFAVMRGDTGQNVVSPITLQGNLSGTPILASGSPRIFCVGNYFVVAFAAVNSGTSYLQYVYYSSVSPTDNNLLAANTIATNFTPGSTVAWDGIVVGTNIYFAYNTTSPTQAVELVKILPGWIYQGPQRFTGSIATIFAMAADTSGTYPIIWTAFYDSASSTGYALAVDQFLSPLLNPTEFITTGTYSNLAMVATENRAMILAELDQDYGFTANVASNLIKARHISITGALGTAFTACRGLGLASKAFFTQTDVYSQQITFLAAYSSPFQPTLFLMVMKSTWPLGEDVFAQPVGRLAYQNAGGLNALGGQYYTQGLPCGIVTDNSVSIAYLYQDLIEAAHKGTDLGSGLPLNPTQAGGVYTQSGVNVATWDFSPSTIDTVELGRDLHMGGGFLWMYDGFSPVEHNFLLYPDIVPASSNDDANWAGPNTSGGHMADTTYYYQITYEWTDQQGNQYYSAPSVPIAAVLSGGSGNGSVTLNIPTLRVTYKGGLFGGSSTTCKICVYRWSLLQQQYYETTSVTAPTENNVNIDYVTITDKNADSTILGNRLIYTTGGVIEDIAAPSTNLMTVFDNRLFLVAAEDTNLLWYSKQVIEATPVEMSDLFTIFISPTISVVGNTGPIRSLGVLDDKLIIGKENALYYINGSGPDNTGANSQYSQPILISSSVGCANQQSMVIMQLGLMFQSNKGIWLLGRDLSTQYIGAPVEAYNANAVTSAVNVPGTNQVRFTLDNGVILMYDYYYGQWSTFSGLKPLTSCIYNDVHALIDSAGNAYLETPGQYFDGTSPVLLSFTTGPLRLGDLQGYQRAYFFYLLGNFYTPHKLYVSVAYDYEVGTSSAVVISPNNYSTPYGSGASQSPYGQGSPYGGPTSLENFRVFLERQRCMAVSISLQEVFDASAGAAPGAGLTLSGINMVCGFKKPFRPQAAATSAGLS